MTHKVSVICPYSGDRQEFRRRLHSVQMQTESDLDIVIVMSDRDFVIDNLENLLYSDRRLRIEIVDAELFERSNIEGSLALPLLGEFVTFCPPGVIYESEKIQLQYDAMCAESLDIAFTGRFLVRQNDMSIGLAEPGGGGLHHCVGTDIFKLGHMFDVASIMARRDSVRHLSFHNYAESQISAWHQNMRVAILREPLVSVQTPYVAAYIAPFSAYLGILARTPSDWRPHIFAALGSQACRRLIASLHRLWFNYNAI